MLPAALQANFGQVHLRHFQFFGESSPRAEGQGWRTWNPEWQYPASGRSSQWGPPTQVPYQAFPTMDVDLSEGDDIATISSDGEADYTGLEHLTPHQVDEQLFWAYEKARRNWRNHMRRPTRSA